MRCFIVFLCILTLCGCNIKSKDSINKQTEISSINESKSEVKVSKVDFDPRFETFTNIDINFLGVYLPVKYIQDLASSRNHSETIHREDAKYHNYLCVLRDKIESNVKWHDGYTIKITDGNEFRFLDDGEIKKIYDQDNFEYVKISDDLDKANEIITNYILNCIFQPLLESDKLQLEKDKIIISKIEYDIILDDMFWPQDNNAILINRENDQYLGLKIINNRYVFYEIISGDNTPFSQNSDTIIYDISL